MSQQAKRTNAAVLVLSSDLWEHSEPAPALVPKDQERPLVPKMWSNSLRMSSTAWFW